jgi:hypothetical protein
VTAGPPQGAKTQRAEILRILIEARGAWVPLPEIQVYSAQYNARIFELRKSCNIENRTDRDESGVVHSWFRLVNSPVTQTPKSSDLPTPDQEWQDRPRVTGLPLFDLAVHS